MKFINHGYTAIDLDNVAAFFYLDTDCGPTPHKVRVNLKDGTAIDLEFKDEASAHIAFQCMSNMLNSTPVGRFDYGGY